MTIDKNYIKEFLKSRKDLLRKKYGVTSIALFGSYARRLNGGKRHKFFCGNAAGFLNAM